METKDARKVISDDKLLELLNLAKKQDPEAMLRLIDLYKEEIQQVSKFIRLPEEDAISTIILEFLELIQDSEYNTVQ
ncbi:hypothetical protein [Paenibacillus lentus]|uniref:Helix-turn-helix conjugative transposon-like domain-containing protein n=1 Tax=Paenibacillus lentus TaxID=1338368 RepID=A0A3S8RQS6_9BACL|nr:hypothetical protein [Paenibacillus lentus]AZK45311.1 hypothetical protein EIM92_03085 [Paenibacillus lentus]